MTKEEVFELFEQNKNEKASKEMLRVGIKAENSFGLNMWQVRDIAKLIKTDHELALELWQSGVHEARLMASMIGDKSRLDNDLMELWVKDINSWDVCDQTMSNYFDKSPIAFDKALEWTERPQEYVKRAGFVLIATLSVHAKKEKDERFEMFFPAIIKHATDERNFVKKAVNWAIRQIGKRSLGLNTKALELCEEIRTVHPEDSTAKWIIADAIRELKSEKVIERLEKKAEKK
jgi:3-methyladenine DNA glycosylase AlkD